MPIAVFGSKIFSVSGNKLYTFDGLSYGSELSTEDQEVEGKKPGTHIKGPGLETLKFNVMLDAQLGMDVRKEIEDWGSIRDATVPQVFIIGEKPLSMNKWLLKGVTAGIQVIDNRGNFLKATLELSFQEYVVQSSDSGSANKVNNKRNNKNKNYAISKGPGGGRMLIME